MYGWRTKNRKTIFKNCKEFKVLHKSQTILTILYFLEVDFKRNNNELPILKLNS